MPAVAYIISFLGMILLPIGLWIYFRHKFALPWKLIVAGALTFIAAQVLHVPLVLGMNSLLQTLPLLANAIILGLLAGIFEETARYILFKILLRNAKSWSEGVLVGLGHGGIEAILLGILAAVSFATMVGYRDIDLSTVPSIPAHQLELARQQVQAYWSAPWYMALLGFVERVFTICLHVSLSVMVLYAVV
ncbi:MAG TPA: YhfC family glutamic-type intramembrane protease [Anaerolineales bacterium]|nr:YhfC family glutamic-type intramembrane protease [Anaerolineales bacterium]